MTEKGSVLRQLETKSGDHYGTGVVTQWGLFETLGKLPPPDTDITYELDYFGKRGPAGGVNGRYAGGFITDDTHEPCSFFGDFESFILEDHGTDILGAAPARRRPAAGHPRPRLLAAPAVSPRRLDRPAHRRLHLRPDVPRGVVPQRVLQRAAARHVDLRQAPEGHRSPDVPRQRAARRTSSPAPTTFRSSSKCSGCRRWDTTASATASRGIHSRFSATTRSRASNFTGATRRWREQGFDAGPITGPAGDRPDRHPRRRRLPRRFPPGGRRPIQHRAVPRRALRRGPLHRSIPTPPTAPPRTASTPAPACASPPPSGKWTTPLRVSCSTCTACGT